MMSSSTTPRPIRATSGLDNTGQLNVLGAADAFTQWQQDHAEIGWTQRPGGPKTHNAFRLPYDYEFGSPQPPWLQTKLLAADIGIFQLGIALGGDSGDFGGNVEVMPPTAAHPLGRLVVGETRSWELSQFFAEQEVQAPVQDLDTEWLEVAHIDEMFGFTYGAKDVVVADPKLAWTVLEAIDAADRGRAVFFDDGGAVPVDGTASADSSADDRLETGTDLRGKPWKYVRITDGAGAGQTARIKTLENGYLTVEKVWRMPSKVIDDGTGVDHYLAHVTTEAPHQAKWFVNPKKDDAYVLVEGSRFWYDSTADAEGSPALISVREVLADADFDKLNRVDAQGKIDAVRTKLDAAAGGAGTLNFLPVPTLYLGERAGFATGRSCFAFAPGLANFQAAKGKLYFPRTFAPRDAAGKDLFEEETKKVVPDALFVEDWDLYHRFTGEVHCGSLTRRTFPAGNWWEKQP